MAPVTDINSAWILRLAAGAIVAAVAALPYSLSAQEVADDPFAQPSEDAGAVENPFAVDSPATDPGDPFDAPSEAPPADEPTQNPFAVPGETGSAAPFLVDPFSEPVPEPEETSPFQRPIDPQLPVGEPQGRIELRYEDPSLRRAVEIRGLYVRGAVEGLSSPSEVQELAASIQAGDFTRAYVEARTPLGTAYISDLEAELPYISASFDNPVSLLRTSLDDKTAVIAVINALQGYNAAINPRPPEQNPLSRFPEFMNESADGETIAPDNYLYMDPGNSQVADYISALLYEVDRNISPDGYLLAGLQYPGSQWGYSERAIEEFRAEVGGEGPPPPGDPVWSAWRRAQLDEVLATVRETLNVVNPRAVLGVQVDLERAEPPASAAEYKASPQYAEFMQDWLGWLEAGLVDEAVFVIHEELSPQGGVLRDWIPFINSNAGDVRPVISLSGGRNYRAGLNAQFRSVRERGIGTILYHYGDPARDVSRGFFQGLRGTLFAAVPGRPVPRAPLQLQPESRNFAAMPAPPPSMLQATPTPQANKNPLRNQPLVLATPTPIATQSPVPPFVPDERERLITLRNGNQVRVQVLSATPNALTIRSLEIENAAPIRINMSAVRDIQPPLE